MRALQKIVRNGNATGVTIPRTMLIKLGWLPGQDIILEECENNMLLVRRPNERDFAPIMAPRILHDVPTSDRT